MECFLLNLPHLRHLQFETKGHIDHIDGLRWQILTEDLITFNFKINVEMNRVDPILDLYRSSFCLLQKRWYVYFVFSINKVS